MVMRAQIFALAPSKGFDAGLTRPRHRSAFLRH
jgi:hypothetical protein